MAIGLRLVRVIVTFPLTQFLETSAFFIQRFFSNSAATLRGSTRASFSPGTIVELIRVVEPFISTELTVKKGDHPKIYAAVANIRIPSAMNSRCFFI
ncbi:unannotated protein [freshwater metagenome]|uniref:Unannotated protein n=1 Tax=freshwater metagenome TaxID=449393 RepID=A0A6J7BBU9_9ZZZZ